MLSGQLLTEKTSGVYMGANEKGAVPIPYIVALLLGIAVVAILGYWFFVLGGQWGGEVTAETCKTRALTYCTSWQILGFPYDVDDTSQPPDIVGWFSDKYKECDSYKAGLGFSDNIDAEMDKRACETILTGGNGDNGGTTTTGSPTTTSPTFPPGP